MASDERRREIAQFLRMRRHRLSPSEVGLAARIAAALRLDPAHARHLFALAEQGSAGEQRVAPRADRIPAHIRPLLEQLEPYPAWVRNDRWDVLAWNRSAALIYGDFGAREPADRNMLCLMFLDPLGRSLLPDWAVVAPRVVAKVRSMYARYVGDRWYQEVLDRLLHGSPEFAAAWADYDVQPYEDELKVFHVRGLGRLAFHYSELALRDDRSPGLTMVIYVPDPAGDTLDRLREVVALPG
jgi:MmyB-like transcription regulator ligand binding domain